MGRADTSTRAQRHYMNIWEMLRDGVLLALVIAILALTLAAI
jgi:hypothetical protein